MSAWLFTAVAFVLGSGVLATVFECLALAGWFTRSVALGIMLLCAGFGAIGIATRWNDGVSSAGRAWRVWNHAGLVSKSLVLILAGFLLYGLSSTGGWLFVDAPAFYLAVSKMIGGTGTLTALPGYDAFSSVGLLGEMQIATLYRLGMSGTDPRVFPWVAFVPVVVLLYGLGRSCGLGRRGAIIIPLIAATSSAVILLWGTGKTDLFAVGPAVAACLLVMAWWDHPDDTTALFIAGVLTGFACVAKLSYVIAFLPVVGVLVIWQVIRRAPIRAPRPIVEHTVRFGGWLTAGVVVAMAPNFIKNSIISGSLSSLNAFNPFFSPATTWRLLLTYPFAITYGRYWGQFGTISPIVLAYAPLMPLFHRPAPRWSEDRTLAITTAALAGLAAWLVLCPSIIATRYILATLLLFAVPAAAAAEALSRRGTLQSLLLVAVALFTVGFAAPHVNINAHSFVGFRKSLSRLLGPQTPCSGSQPFDDDCRAMEAINAEAAPGDRVLILGYVRLWLRPDLLQAASATNESALYDACGTSPCAADEFWRVYRTHPGFRFILNDSSTHALPEGVFAAAPVGVMTRQLFSGGTISAYEVTLSSR